MNMTWREYVYTDYDFDEQPFWKFLLTHMLLEQFNSDALVGVQLNPTLDEDDIAKVFYLQYGKFFADDHVTLNVTSDKVKHNDGVAIKLPAGIIPNVECYEDDSVIEWYEALAAELTFDMMKNVIAEIEQSATTKMILGNDKIEDFMFDPSFGSKLAVKINDVANNIGRETRRGCGNVIVAGPMMASILQAATDSFKPSTKKGTVAHDLIHVGTLNGTIEVYSSIFSDLANNEIIVGYKGRKSEIDAGMILSINSFFNLKETDNVLEITPKYGIAKHGQISDYYVRLILE